MLADELLDHRACLGPELDLHRDFPCQPLNQSPCARPTLPLLKEIELSKEYGIIGKVIAHRFE